MKRFAPLILAAVIGGSPALAADPADALLEARLEAHITFLADDLLEGDLSSYETIVLGVDGMSLEELAAALEEPELKSSVYQIRARLAERNQRFDAAVTAYQAALEKGGPYKLMGND